MLTVGALCSEMEASGRSMSERKARDWWSKGLIPQPDSDRPGRGRGKGRVAASWSDRRVLAQARSAYDLLDRYPRADFARLSLWLLGYDIKLSHVRTAYAKSVRHHLRSVRDLGGKSREENIGRLAEIVACGWSKEKGAPTDVREAMADLALAFLEPFYGTDSEFAGHGLAKQWRKVVPFVGGSSSQSDNPSDAHLKTLADYLRKFASLSVQGEAVRSATDYELMRARRLLRFVVGSLRRFDRSVDRRDDIERVGGLHLVAFGRLAVPILVAVLRKDAIRQEVMYWLLDTAKRIRHNAMLPAHPPELECSAPATARS